jgi:hypothetical protein
MKGQYTGIDSEGCVSFILFVALVLILVGVGLGQLVQGCQQRFGTPRIEMVREVSK